MDCLPRRLLRGTLVLVVTVFLYACSNSSTSPAPTTGATGCARTSTGAEPLNDLRGSYKGDPGGLYPGGSNAPSAGHLVSGFLLARAITPLDSSGNPSASGQYAFISIGPSFATQEFSVFKPLADADGRKRAELVIVDGAQGGTTAQQWASPSCPCWSVVEQRLAAAGLTPMQVVTAWIKLLNTNPTEPFPAHADMLRDNLISVVQNLRGRFPNLRLAYLSSRAYGGYATTALSPEPYAYETGFAVRAVIAAQIAGDSRLGFDPALGASAVPWLAWGPYLWADGLRPRSDGLTWACSDFVPEDGTHPSDSGRLKVANLLLQFLTTDSTARVWFSR